MAGTVWKRGGVWQITYDKPRDANGKRQQRQLSCPGMTKKQAQQKLADINSALLRGTYIDASTMTLTEYLNSWLDYHQKSRIIADTTLRGYEAIVRRYLIPHLGQLRLDHIRPLHIQQFYTFMLDTGGKAKNGLSAKTVRNTHGCLHGAFTHAIRMQMLSSNPADAIQPPRYVRPKIRTATREQMADLMIAIEHSKWRIPILITMVTGMRRGEVCGLRWDDFDQNRGLLMVRRAIVQVPGQIITKEPKTRKSRAVSLPRSIAKELFAWRKEQLAMGNAPNGWICTHPDGRLITPESVGKGFMRLTRKIGVSVTLHGLRHTQATELIMSGIPVKVVAERLGHANVSITQDIYTHVMPHMQDAAAEVVEQLIYKTGPKITLIDGDC